jgi:hypothetical protein
MRSQDTHGPTPTRRVRLIRKVADYLNGIDVSRYEVDDVFELHPLEAELLIAEGWAIPEYTVRTGRDRRSGDDRRQVRDAADANASADHRPSAGRAPGSRRTVARLRADRSDAEQQRAAADERRRTENQIRDELHDSRAKTLRHHDKEPSA